MTMKMCLIPLLILGTVVSAFAVEWENVDDAHYIAGRKCSSGYMRGKVVLVCSDKSLVLRMEDVWTSYKSKPFVLIGDYPKRPKSTSYPVYDGIKLGGDAKIRKGTPLYVVDAVGRVRYKGMDERKATEVVVTLLTDLEAPKNEIDAATYLKFELANLPAQACIRYHELKKQYPEVAKAHQVEYVEIAKNPEIRKLVELVKFAKSVKDRSLDQKQGGNSRLVAEINGYIKKCAALKESEDENIAQEAKNALADLAWAKATL